MNRLRNASVMPAPTGRMVDDSPSGNCPLPSPASGRSSVVDYHTELANGACYTPLGDSANIHDSGVTVGPPTHCMLHSRYDSGSSDMLKCKFTVTVNPSVLHRTRHCLPLQAVNDVEHIGPSSSWDSRPSGHHRTAESGIGPGGGCCQWGGSGD